MHTTFYRSLALLVSIFTLTSSFSLSSLGTQKDQNPWVFEYARGNNLTEFKVFEDGQFSSKEDNKGLIELVTSFAKKLRLERFKEKLHSAFRIYKKGKDAQQMIGLIIERQENKAKEVGLHLYYYEKKIKRCMSGYSQVVLERRIDLSTPNEDPIQFYSSKGEKCMLSVKWKGFEPIKNNVVVSFDEQGNIQMADHITTTFIIFFIKRQAVSMLIGCLFLSFITWTLSKALG